MKKARPVYAGIAVLAIMMCLSLAVLASCGGSGSGSGDSANGSQKAASSASASQSSQTSSTASSLRKLEVEGCKLLPERFVIDTTVAPNASEQSATCALSFLMEGSDVPVSVSPFGAVSGLSIKLSYEKSSTMLPEFVRFERVNDVDGYGTRVTYFYRCNSSLAALPQELNISVAEKPYDSTSYRFGSGADEVPVENGHIDWPTNLTDLTALGLGKQTVSLKDELIMSSDYIALHNALDSRVLELFDDCLLSLRNSGAVDTPKEGDPNEYFLFDSGTCDLVFHDTSVGNRLSADLQVDMDNVVFFAGRNISGNGEGVYLNPALEGNIPDVPNYYPASTMITRSTGPFDIPDDKVGKFADSLDDCKYVVAYMGLKSRVDKEFYMGGADRRLVTTIVVVMDVDTREFVHIHVVGTDAPGVTTKNPTGSTKVSEAKEYMCSLL